MSRDAPADAAPPTKKHIKLYILSYSTTTTNTPYTGVNTTNSQVVVNAGAGDDVIVLGPNDNLRDVVELDTNFGNDSLVGFKSDYDKINVNAFLNDASKFKEATSDSLLGDSQARISTSFTASAKSGIFSQEEVNSFIADNKINFADSADPDAKAVLLLHDMNEDGTQHVYTVVQLTNGSTEPTASVAGSLTLDANNTSGISFSNLSTSNAFDATNPSPDDPNKKGGSTYDATAGETIDASGDHNYNIHISSELFKNGDTLTITGFGSDDQISFDDALSGFVFGNKIVLPDGTVSNDSAVFQFTDAAGDLISITIQSDSFNANVINDLLINSVGVVQDFNTIFNDGTGVDTITNAGA